MADIQSKFAALTTKQKVIGALTVVIVIFIIYEIIGLFPSSAPAEPAAPAAAKPMNATAPTTAATQAMPAPGQANANPSATLPTVSTLTVRRDTETLKDQDEQQKAYLDSLNQLQLLKLKREIAETNQAIAAARLATETANKNMTDLLTQPAPASVPLSTYANKLAGVTTEEAPPTPKSAPVEPDVPFVVISVAMQFQRWEAVLGYQGKFYSVSIGDSLLDGSTVAAINRQGVVLVKDGKKRKLSMTTTLPTSEK